MTISAAAHAVASVDFGGFPVWISAIASLLAVVGAGYAGWGTWRIYKIESSRDEGSAKEMQSRDAAVRQLQASRVSAWYSSKNGLDADSGNGVYVLNASDSPVYQVNLSLHDDTSDTTETHSKSVLPPTRKAINIWQPSAPKSEAYLDEVGIRVQMTFTDAAGVRWQRNRYGQLNQLATDLNVVSGTEMGDVLTHFAEDFRLGYGVNLNFVPDLSNADLRREFIRESSIQVVSDEKVIDAFVGPHDWLGELLGADALAEVHSPSVTEEPPFVSAVRRAVSQGGRQYGIPTAVDTMVLLRNMELVPDAPATFDEMLKVGGLLQESGATARAICIGVGPTGDPFQMWPIFTSGGGWLFGKDSDGEWNQRDIGLDSEGSVAGFQLLRDLGDSGAKILDTSIDQARARELFYTGQSAYLLDMYRGMKGSRAPGFEVGCSKIPPFVGRSAPSSFYVVYAFFVSAYGNRQVAEDFLPHYLDFRDVAESVSRELSGPVIRGSAVLVANEIASASLEACLEASPMPSFAEMPAVWNALGIAEVQAIRGGDPHSVARQAQSAVRDAFSTSMPIPRKN